MRARSTPSTKRVEQDEAVSLEEGMLNRRRDNAVI